MIIYLDVLLVINIYVNFLLLKGTEKFLGRPTKQWRITAGALIGSLSCLVFLLPENLNVILLPLKLISGAVIVLITFGYGGLRNFLKSVLLFFCINFLFAGMITASEFLFNSSVMSVRNGVLYLDLSLLTLIGATIAAYIILSVFHMIMIKKRLQGAVCQVTVVYNRNTAVLSALEDTGNQLVDYFTGKPVILCNKERIARLLPDCGFSLSDIPKGFRVIPLSTVNSKGTAYIFKPDKVFIKETGENAREITALIGFTEENKMSEEAILNPNLL